MFRNRSHLSGYGLVFAGKVCAISGAGFFGADGLIYCRLIVLGLEISRI